VIDPYVLLGVERDADEAAIKSAYRKVAKAAHPDSGGDAEQFARLQTAYELLKDPVRRKVFDDTGYDPQLADAKDILELERHRTRVRKHMDRLGRKPETDELSSMLRARSQSIAEAIRNAEAQIEAIEQAYTMLEGYSYELESVTLAEPLLKGEAAE